MKRFEILRDIEAFLSWYLDVESVTILVDVDSERELENEGLSTETEEGRADSRNR
jgi:hypothetical protein